MISLVARSLIVAGVLILVLSLTSVHQLIGRLPPGSVRNRWYTMTALIVGFVIGYASYAAAFWNDHSTLLQLIVPGVFFFGACFVWLTGTLSLPTARDLMRVSLLELETLRDPLTGVFNRRYLDRRLAEEVARASRYQLPLSILMLDIDHFKRVNDDYGHQTGDQMLVELGKIIARELRASDVFVRYGGEEFLVITPNTPLAIATDIAERLRKRIDSNRFELSGECNDTRCIKTSVSIGVATFGVAAANAEQLIHVADRNLYGAKHAGRNRVVADLPVDP